MREYRTREKIELQLDNRQIVSFVAGSLVVLGVVFALGVLVGKQLALGAVPPAKPADPLAALDARQKVLVAPPDAGAPPADLSFATELTRPQPTLPGAEPKPARPTEKVAAAPSTKESPAPEPAAKAPERAPKAPERVAEEPAAKAPEKAAKAPEKAAEEPARRKEGLSAAFDKAAPKGPAAEGFTLQVASLPSRADAEKVVSQLSAKGYKASIVEAEVAGKGRYYRVRVGSFGARSDAEEGARSFKKKAGMDALVVPAK